MSPNSLTLLVSPFANPLKPSSSTQAMGMKKPASSRKSPTKNAIEPGSALEPEEADATVAEPTGTEAAENQEEIAN